MSGIRLADGLANDPSEPIPAHTSGAGRVRRGRRPTAELTAIRARVEPLMLTGLRSPAIHRALTGPESPNPIVISERGVRDHMRAVEHTWRERASGDALEADRAKALAIIEDAVRIASTRSTMHAGSNVGVGYFNAYLKAQERWAKLRGLDAPGRTELTGRDGDPLEFSDIAPLRHGPTSPEDELVRLDLRRTELELVISLGVEPTQEEGTR
jgi:hypothetical protein